MTQWRSQPSLSGWAKFKNLSDLYFFFPISPLFSDFSSLNPIFLFFPELFPLFPGFWQNFRCQREHSAPCPPAPLATLPIHVATYSANFDIQDAPSWVNFFVYGTDSLSKTFCLGFLRDRSQTLVKGAWCKKKKKKKS